MDFNTRNDIPDELLNRLDKIYSNSTNEQNLIQTSEPLQEAPITEVVIEETVIPKEQNKTIKIKDFLKELSKYFKTNGINYIDTNSYLGED